jgi:hypothetical protein
VENSAQTSFRFSPVSFRAPRLPPLQFPAYTHPYTNTYVYILIHIRRLYDYKHVRIYIYSYLNFFQLVVTDFKYFNRIKWQYLVLDEAQAIKSSSSQRWKMLLEFRCRNRLLVSISLNFFLLRQRKLLHLGRLRSSDTLD